MTQERMLKMERTYVSNFIFKVLAVCGVLAAICVAGLSDSDVLSTAEVFIYGGTAFFAACLGVWGTSNCTRAIEAERERQIDLLESGQEKWPGFAVPPPAKPRHKKTNPTAKAAGHMAGYITI